MGAVPFSEVANQRPLHAYQVLVLALVASALVFDGIDLQILPLVSPTIVDEWSVGRAAFGWPLSAALVGMGIGAVAGGALGDRFGRRNTLAAAIAVFGLATIASAFADGIAALTLLRLVGGLGFGAAGPNGLALASEWMPERWRTYAISILVIGTPAGTMIGALLVPLLLPAGGWRGTFAVFGGVSLLLVLLIVLAVRESPAFLMAKGAIPRARRHARIVLGQEPELAPEPARAAATDPGEREVGLFHASNLRFNIGIALGFTACTAVFFGLSNWSPLLLQGAGFESAQLVGANFALGLISIVGALVAGYAVRAAGSRRLLIGVSLATFVCLLALAAVIGGIDPPPSTSERWSVYALAGLAGGIASLGVATLYTLMTLGYPLSCRSTGIGFGMLMGRLGGIAMSAGGGVLLDLSAGSTLPFFAVLALCALLVAAAAWIVDRHV